MSVLQARHVVHLVAAGAIEHRHVRVLGGADDVEADLAVALAGGVLDRLCLTDALLGLTHAALFHFSVCTFLRF